MGKVPWCFAEVADPPELAMAQIRPPPVSRVICTWGATASRPNWALMVILPQDQECSSSYHSAKQQAVCQQIQEV